MSLRQPPGMTKRSPFRYSKTLPEIIRLAVMLYIRFPLSLRNVEDLLHERGIEISDKTVRFWWNRFGPFPPETGMRVGKLRRVRIRLTAPAQRFYPAARLSVSSGCRSAANAAAQAQVVAQARSAMAVP